MTSRRIHLWPPINPSTNPGLSISPVRSVLLHSTTSLNLILVILCRTHERVGPIPLSLHVVAFYYYFYFVVLGLANVLSLSSVLDLCLLRFAGAAQWAQGLLNRIEADFKVCPTTLSWVCSVCWFCIYIGHVESPSMSMP